MYTVARLNKDGKFKAILGLRTSRKRDNDERIARLCTYYPTEQFKSVRVRKGAR